MSNGDSNNPKPDEAQVGTAFVPFERLFNAAPAMISVHEGPDHTYIYCNPAHDRAIGHRDVLGKPIREAVTELEGQNVFERLDHVYRTGAPMEEPEFEASVDPGDGKGLSRSFYRQVLQPWHDSNGDVAGVMSFAFDISEQVESRLRAEESEARFRTVFSTIDQGYCLCEIILDPAGQAEDYRFLEVNDHFEQMTGLKDATGRRALDLVPGLEKKWVETYARVAVLGETLRFEDDSAAMGRRFDVFAMPIPPQGKFAIVFKDVTKERNTQDALRQSEAEFRTITEAMPQMVWTTKPDGFHEFFNAQWYEFTGVPEGSTDGEGWSDVFHPDDQEETWARWRHSLATGELYEIEYRLRHHSGAYRWVLGRAQPVRDASGGIMRWLGTCTDIHEIKIAEEQRQLMLGEMNHRVKNTLTMVQSIVSQTLRHATSLKDASASIHSRIANMAQAHDRLIHSEWTETHIRSVVDAALVPHRTGSGRFKLDGPDIPVGSKQALALTMALHELATNATKYGGLSTENGCVSVIWGVEKAGGEETFNLSWTESGGPPVVPPSKSGFGSRMVEQALAGYFDGEAELSFEPSGLTFELKAPRSGLKS